MSGGLPHSEIPGSKLILSSPGLIAEYHVLHRLLLPRHPPNALFALDLIQKEQDLGPFVWLCKLPLLLPASRLGVFLSEVILSTPPTAGSQVGVFLVSVLDLDKTAVVQDQTGSVFCGPA